MSRAFAIAGLVSAMALARMASGDEAIEFARDVQPILQRHCTKCHGGVRREAGLSLLAPGGAGESGKPLIVAGKPDESELLRRVTTTDADERMPAESRRWQPHEIATLRRWIEAGGELAQALVVRAARRLSIPPDVANPPWCRNADRPLCPGAACERPVSRRRRRPIATR